MVLESAAGFYIGRVEYQSEDDMTPYSRNSAEYWKTKKEAQEALESGNYIEKLWH